MKFKTLAILAAASTVALLFAFTSAPQASAGARFDIGFRVDIPPPVLRHEVVVVRPGPGYVWVPGYWDWSGPRRNYVWVGGVWARPPYRNAIWVGPRWERRHGEVFFMRGHWRR
ncbi:MAG TPA: YXWGXW repeat-containing protein [Thermoanaerobaculia bacterium]